MIDFSDQVVIVTGAGRGRRLLRLGRYSRYGTCITTLHPHREAAVRELLGIPDSFVQGCLLPVARLRAGHEFRAAPRRHP